MTEQKDHSQLPSAGRSLHAGGVAHLGRQHAVPARRRPDHRRGLRRQRGVLRGDGAVRDPDGRGGRHARPPGVVSPVGRRARGARPCSTSWRNARVRASSCSPRCRWSWGSGSPSTRERSRPGSSTRWRRSAPTRNSITSSPGRSRSPGVAMLVGTTSGGFLGQIDLAVPFGVRAALLAALFGRVVAFDARPRFRAPAARAVPHRRGAHRTDEGRYRPRLEPARAPPADPLGVTEGPSSVGRSTPRSPTSSTCSTAIRSGWSG